MDLFAFQKEITEHPLTGVYFTTPDCRVCRSIKPGIVKLFDSNPDTHLLFTNMTQSPDVSGQYLVFTVPTLILFIVGKEFARYSRFIHLPDAEASLKRMVSQMDTDSNSKFFNLK